MQANKHEWISKEKDRILMTQRKSIFVWILLIITFFLLEYQSNLIVAFSWASFAILIEIFIKIKFNEYLGITKSQILSNNSIKVIESYKRIWIVKMVLWGTITWISASQQTIEAHFLTICVLNFIALLTVAQNSPHLKFSEFSLLALITPQWLGLAWHSVFTFNFNPPNVYYMYFIFLIAHYFSLIKIISIFSYSLDKNLNLNFELHQKTEQLTIEKEIVNSSSEIIQRFYSNAAHDVRQPVYAMQLYTEMLQSDSSKNSILLPKIQQSCLEINNLFNSLFDFQQLRLGRMTFRPEKVSIKDCFNELSLQFTPLANQKGLDIFFKITEGYVFIDEILLKRILGNLVTNAIRYTETGRILVISRKRKDFINFEVWDTGIGIDGDDQALVFNEFFKIANENIPNEGFGLGLSIVKQLVSQVIGSEISVKSKKNSGTVFRFSVPIELYILKSDFTSTERLI